MNPPRPNIMPLTLNDIPILLTLQTGLTQALKPDRSVCKDFQSLLSDPEVRAVINRALPDEGAPALFRAIRSSAPNAHEVVQSLIEAGSDVNVVSDKANTPLLEGLWHLNVKEMWRVRVLLEAGANANARASDGYTALHRLLHVDHPQEIHVPTIAMLLEHGADPLRDTDDHDGRQRYPDAMGRSPCQGPSNRPTRPSSVANLCGSR